MLSFSRITILSIGLLVGFCSCCAVATVAQDQWQADMRKINPNTRIPFKIDEAAIDAAGIRKISGKHVDLYTDVREEGIEELVVVFDQSVSQWCKIFSVADDKAKTWKIRAFLIADRSKPDKFKLAGVMPADLPEFLAGFQRDHNLWLYLQPGNYYTRHLFIHEGTHAFMQWFLNGYGAPWYSEGVAELVGVHSWKDSKLSLNYRLRDRSEAEQWGRVKKVKDDWKAGNAMTLQEVLSIPPKSFLQVRYYAWSWAACDFFSKHPKTKKKFWNMQRNADLDASRFNRNFQRMIQKDWDELQIDWALYISEIEYGYQIERGRIVAAKALEKTIGKTLGKDDFEIQSNQSWQTTTIEVKKGERFKITGKGEFKVGPNPFSLDSLENPDPAATSKPWKSQSHGITIEYYRGKPLGMLMAGVYNSTADNTTAKLQGLFKPIAVGESNEIVMPYDGTLCFRINESPARLDDNDGTLNVTVKKLK